MIRDIHNYRPSTRTNSQLKADYSNAITAYQAALHDDFSQATKQQLLEFYEARLLLRTIEHEIETRFGLEGLS
jgi:hypothetical protein